MIKSKINKLGYISGINGSLITVKGIEKIVKLHDLVKVTNHNIIGEIIQIYSNRINVQCFENTDNLRLGEEVLYLEEPLSMELGPGLLSNVFDGIQRPLDKIYEMENSGFIKRGIDIPALSRDKKWHFIPQKKIGDKIDTGDVIGIVEETPAISHYILVPPGVKGSLTFLKEEGNYTVSEDLYEADIKGSKKTFNMIQKWPVIKSRPFYKKLTPKEPLITGQRILDLLFPVAKGGTVAIPGGFGTGKTVIQQSLAKWCNADIIIFIGCGERGNEIADVLQQFVELIDPRSGRPLLERIILIANTSNMPVSARESSIFSGITIAEYYRDMGYDVTLQADSTSRWAEALREISGLLEEMPAEGGYPAYLPSRLSSFYERAGIVETLGKDNLKHNKIGSLTVIGSVSPPAGDFSEPITSNTKRFVQAFWALDAELAYEKHYPAVNWLESYSNYPRYIRNWWSKIELNWVEIELDWFEGRNQINEILSRENDLKNMTQLVGEENLPEDQQLDLFIAEIIKEAILIQNAFDNIDAFTSPKKIIALINIILILYRESRNLLKEDFYVKDIRNLSIIEDILRIKNTISNDRVEKIGVIKDNLINELKTLKRIHGVIGK
ncbi:MAG: V-type ATP synthase subunit A [Candidatus Lokiarchaeota archaeon]|nr:V-type ATP synthase subunit A [Candidatus Lokiarchaeota archaeon]